MDHTTEDHPSNPPSAIDKQEETQEIDAKDQGRRVSFLEFLK
jgi:hypothetical protein